ncbi:putative membrane associated transporter [Cryptosporidium xiaoi]|uniref:Membrane associated transporter n=1 Tax=Cryptosporidium xiaoi TaxID=659607 RepID=A0AAV9Y0L3_9CRYT
MRISKLVRYLLSRNREYLFPIIGSSIIHWSLGFAYTLGNIIPYIASYMSLSGKNYVGIGNMCWIEGVFVLVQGASNYIYILSMNYLNYSAILFAGVFCSSLGLFLSYLFLDNLLVYTLSYSIIYAAGHGILYSSTIELVSNFYGKELSSNIMGILWLFRGLSTAVIPSVQTLIVNPKDIYYNLVYNNDKLFSNLSVIERIPKLFQFMFIFSTITQLVGSVVLIKGIKNIENNKENITKEISKSQLFGVSDITSSESFKILWLIAFLTWPCIQHIQLYWKIHGIFNTKLGDKQLSRMSSITLLSHTFFRIFWGVFGEIVGYLNCICTLTSILISGLLLLMFPLFESTSIVQYLVGYILVSIAHSGTSVVFPSILVGTFGSSKFFISFLLLFTAKALSCFLFCLLTELTTKYLNLQYSLIPLLIFSIGSFFLSFILKDTRSKYLSIEQEIV